MKRRAILIVLASTVICFVPLGLIAGYSTGYDKGKISGYSIHDPTYAEMEDFLRRDNTDKNRYNKDNYVCHDFAIDVIKNAEGENIRCAFVYILFSSSDHAIVAFNTIDRGLVYIEPQNDARARVVVGETYLAWGAGFETVCSGDAVVSITVAWPVFNEEGSLDPPRPVLGPCSLK